MPFIFSTTLLLYKLDTLLLKQKNLPVLDITDFFFITGFFFRIRTQATRGKRNPLYLIRTKVVTRVRMRKKKPVISNTHQGRRPSTNAEKKPVISNTTAWERKCIVNKYDNETLSPLLLPATIHRLQG